MELGLRGKLRHNADGDPENTFNSNGDGTYSFDAGVAPGQSAPSAVWSFEWSINTNYDESTQWMLDDLAYELGLDSDPSAATTYGTLFGLSNPFDPINDLSCWDHSTGTNATANGGGTEANCSSASGASDYAALIAGNNVAQNSWKPHWFISGFDPTVDGQYDLYLAAYDGDELVARTDISIIVGNGAPVAVPAPATCALFALGLGISGLGSQRSRG